MEDILVINGVEYIRKSSLSGDGNEHKSKYNEGCKYYTFPSSSPDAKLKDLSAAFPNLNVFFVGKKGYCGRVCVEVRQKDLTIDFLERLLLHSDGFSGIILGESTFQAMVDEEMSKPDLH